MQKIIFTWHIFPSVEPANPDCSREHHSSLKDNQRKDNYSHDSDSVTIGILLFEGLNNLISTLCVCANGLQGLLNAFHYPIQLLTFYLLL
jgi:hypothetical protein